MGGAAPGSSRARSPSRAIVLTFNPTDRAALDVPGVGEVVYVSTFVVVARIIGSATESLRTERAKAMGRARQIEQLQETTAELAWQIPYTGRPPRIKRPRWAHEPIEKRVAIGRECSRNDEGGPVGDPFAFRPSSDT